VVMCRRSLSGLSSISVDESIQVDPRENNYDSSESESERNEIEACVLTHRHVRRPVTATATTTFNFWLFYRISPGKPRSLYCCTGLCSLNGMLFSHPAGSVIS